jgi:putative copper resistance protein D
MNEHLLDGVLVRGAVYLALAISVGPILWAWGVERSRTVARGRWRRIAALALLGFACVVGIVQATLAFAERWSLADAAAVLSDTAYGRMLGVHVIASVGHGLALASGRPGPAMVTALAAMLTVTLLGHAGVQGGGHVAVQVAHAAAAIAWLGGLVVLIEQIARRAVGVAAVRRWSRVALVLVGVLAVTGGVRTASFVVGGARELVWLGVLMVKLGFFAGALAVAYGHRRTGFHGVRDAGTDAAWRRFQRLLILELWLVACALLLAALLSQLPPP